MGKFVKVRFASVRKEARASVVRKIVERDLVGVGSWWATQASTMEM
jgi:hypothetical protein